MRPCGVDEHWEVPAAYQPAERTKRDYYLDDHDWLADHARVTGERPPPQPAERTFIPGGPLGQKATTVRQLADAARQLDPPQTEETLP